MVADHADQFTVRDDDTLANLLAAFEAKNAMHSGQAPRATGQLTLLPSKVGA
jgi:hypothetical protein